MGLVFHYIQHAIYTLPVLQGSEIYGVVDLATVKWIVLALDLINAGYGALAF